MDNSTAGAEDPGNLPSLSTAEQSPLPRDLKPQPALSPAALATYATFYREFVTDLVAFLVWQGARLSDAADFAQEAMIRAYRNWSSIEHPRAWAKRVASREYARHLAQVEDPVGPVELSPLLPPALDTSEWEEHHDVLLLLALLPPRQRQVMAWWLDGYGTFEIADELNITAANVRANLMRARRTLGMHLGLPEGGPQ